MDLFDQAREQVLRSEAPLAARMRPMTLEQFAGQAHVLGPGRLLRRAIQADRLSSVIFHGPPGTGKTTLARIVANTTRAHFTALNAVLSGVADIRSAVGEAERRLGEHGVRTILFIDEVHRFNKAQQDALLPHVENGTVILIGATTENPYFEVNKPLVSRSRIFRLKPLEETDLRGILAAALADPERGYGRLKVRLADDALAHLARVANGDARAALNALELAVETTQPDASGTLLIDLAVAEESIQRKAVLYDKEGDAHFDAISAFIKSLRGSDADAALYWMARMVYAGEDPRFIFRRMIIFAAEDIGLADPEALRVAVSAAQAFDYVGLPEGRFHLAEACLYLATAPKSNSAFAFFDALKAVEAERAGEVPDHLKDANRDAEGFGHGEGYLYPHAYHDHWVAQQYLPDNLRGRVFYDPSEMGFEARLRTRVQQQREAALAALAERERGPAALLETGPLETGPLEKGPLEKGPLETEPLEKGPRERGAAAGPSPGGPGAAEWSARGRDTVAQWLGRVRSRMMELAETGRQHLVLDANAGTGLLTWEALRASPEGGVWARVDTAEEAGALAGGARLLPALAAPVVVQVALERLPEEIAAQAGEPVRFDRIVARDALAAPGKAEAPEAPEARVALLADLLAPGGRMVLAERAPGLGERVLASLDWSGVPAPLAARAMEAEAKLYEEAGDGPGTLDDEALAQWCGRAGLKVLAREVMRQRVEFSIGPALLERWFGSGSGSPGPLAARLGDDASAVRGHLERMLAGGPLRRVTAVVLVAAEREAAPPPE